MIGGVLLKNTVKQPVELLATIGLPLFGSGVELLISVKTPNSSASILLPLYMIK